MHFFFAIRIDWRDKQKTSREKDMDAILNKLPLCIRNNIMSLPNQAHDSMEEIRIRVGYPILVAAGGKEYFVGTGPDGKSGNADKNLVNAVLNSIISYSMHAVQEELADGYVTIAGGHRIGVCGRVVTENGKVLTIKDISSLNIRRSRELKGISEPVMQYIYKDKGRTQVCNTLIISPPKCGKTTLLRDIIRNVSSRGFRTGVVDERSELAAVAGGMPSYDLGPRSDVLDGCPKEKGMIMMIRSMAPEVMATDEIGKPGDVYAIDTAHCAGIAILTTIHGSSWEDVRYSAIGDLIQRGVFERLIYLSNRPSTGSIVKVTDGENHVC